MRKLERIGEIFAGLVLLTAGIGIIYAFQQTISQKGRGIWEWGILLFVEAYSIIGVLFVLLGLRYLLGPRSFIEKVIAWSLRHLLLVAILIMVMGLVLYMVVLRTSPLDGRRFTPPFSSKIFGCYDPVGWTELRQNSPLALEVWVLRKECPPTPEGLTSQSRKP